MFSLQALNPQSQILIGISQITSRHSGLLKQKKTSRSVQDIRKEFAAAHNEPICAESLQEAVRNLDGSFVAELRGVDAKTLAQRVERPLPSRPDKLHSDYASTKQASFISGRNFEENRIATNTLPDSTLTLYTNFGTMRFNISDRLLTAVSPCSTHVQARGFKTDRSVDAEQKRNPTGLQRFYKFMGISGGDKPTATSEAAPRLDRLLKEEMGSLGNTNLSREEKDKIKIAFAEGYLAGSLPENQRPTKASKYLKLVQQMLTIVLFLAIFVSLMASVGGSVFRIQLGNQVEVDPEEITVTFDDVKGADEAKQELKDVVEFLKSPEKFSTLGGKLPKGVLLVGPPGTGKTLLARAVAGEAGVPFFHAAGPEFDEILVGQGARRVRDLFKAAKERSPCVVFIDEIDSVGAKRTNSVLHPYANQTINQLLSEMDGFHQNEGVIVLGATNRREDLDQALLRPGRFDVEVTVPTPDYSGRRDILSLYLSRVAAHTDIDVDVLARGTTGFTGADLENMVNQAALKAAMDGMKTVTMKYLEGARDKVLMGPERRSRLPDEEANIITAYHEGGHAVVAYYTKESHPLHKVTIIPRGPSLGHTAYIPARERYHVTKQQMLAMMDTMMGGRAAEELVFGPDKITSGASSDLKQATSIACHMVRDLGMSEKVGLRTMEPQRGPLSGGEQLGPYTSELVDGEIKKIMSESYERAKNILKTHAKEHKALAEALLKYETLDADEIKAIMSGEKIRTEGSAKSLKEQTVPPVPPGMPAAGLLGTPAAQPA